MLDINRIEGQIDENTRVVFVCNPNNPTGTILDSGLVEDFLMRMPSHVLVIVDEAYSEFVTDDRYRTVIPLALERGNVVVLRTFSKIYGLAGHRIGYAIGHGQTMSDLRKAQQPLTVSTVAQAAALASLGNEEELQRRLLANAAGRRANFLFFRMPATDSHMVSDMFTEQGVIIRPMFRGWIRVTVGSEEENRRFVEVLDHVLAALES